MGFGWPHPRIFFNVEHPYACAFLILLWGLNKECPKLLCGLGTDYRKRKTIPVWNSSGEGVIKKLKTEIELLLF